MDKLLVIGRLKRFLKIVRFVILGLFLLSIGSVIFYRYVPIPYTFLMVTKSLNSFFNNGPIRIAKNWVPIEEIARPMQMAVIKAEDAKFYTHNGFDFEAIEKALKYNQTHKKQKGASTISQQTAKNVFLWPTRSWIRKGMEFYFTILIEMLWDKKRILEVYLNVIELGPNVYGVEAAAQKYFRKKARHLNLAEASLIAAVLPNPIKFKINKPSAYILRRQQKIMGRGSVVKPKEVVEDSKEFFDIKFDNDDESDSGVEPSDSTPANE